MRYIIVGNSPYKTFNKLYKPEPNDYFIGLDVGSNQIIESGFKLNESWGDFDRISSYQYIKEHTTNFNLFPERKNETDLELILNNLSKLNIHDEIYIYDVTGGRLDHELINILLLHKYSQLNIKIVDEYNEITYIDKPGKYEISSDQFDYVGIITLDKAEISIEVGEYILPKVMITRNDTYTTSNKFLDHKFNFTLYSGNIILIKSK